MKLLIIAVALLLLPVVGLAQGLEEKTVYRLDVSVYDLVSVRDETPGIIAGAGSKFVVIGFDADKEVYIVRFITVDDPEKDPVSNKKIPATVKKDEAYKLKRIAGGLPIEKSVQKAMDGFVSGPLIVPFKYRQDDGTISGQATVGLYIGYAGEPKIYGTEQRISIAPFIAGGVTQIDVASNGATQSRSGFTLATGLLIKNWANANFGAVYGSDWIGDKTWAHEGKGWVSVMVGWTF